MEMTLSKTITYYWTDGSNVGTYEIDVSLVGDDTADPNTGWLPGFELWITLLAIIASLFFNRTRRYFEINGLFVGSYSPLPW